MHYRRDGMQNWLLVQAVKHVATKNSQRIMGKEIEVHAHLGRIQVEGNIRFWNTVVSQTKQS